MTNRACSVLRRFRRDRRRAVVAGFTLTELMLVVGIITIVAFIAVPAFKALTGGRSTEAAYNQLAGLLGRSRAEAIGLQKVHGVAFFRPEGQDRIQAVMVRQAENPTVTPPGLIVPDLYLDFIEDRDPVLLPVGVGLQVTDSCIINPGDNTPAITDDVRNDDAYIGYHTSNINGATNLTYGGVILFDGYGRLVSKTYGFKCYLDVPGGGRKASTFGKTYNMGNTPANDLIPPRPNANDPLLRSSFGFVVFDQETFNEQDGATAGDPQIDGSLNYGVDHPTNEAARTLEAKEERWLDANARAMLVNRNNGTLIRGE